MEEELKKIPFCKTTLGPEELEAMQKVMESGWVVLGSVSEEFERQFAEYFGAKHAVFVDSGTSALFLSMQALKAFNQLDPEEDRIEVPSLTFTATAEAVINAGFRVDFVDVEKNYCIPANEISLPVHLMGNKAKQGALIYDSAHRFVRNDYADNAEAMNGFWPLYCYSLYATKNMTTVQGGMIITNDDNVAAWLKKARDHGLDKGTKERYAGKYAQYDVQFVGWRVKGDDLRASIGIEQLKKLPWMNAERSRIVGAYNDAFGLNREGNHVYPIFVRDQESFLSFMNERKIQCTIHFKPLHKMTGYRAADNVLPRTEWIGQHIVSLPMFPGMTVNEQERVIKAVKDSDMMVYEPQ